MSRIEMGRWILSGLLIAGCASKPTPPPIQGEPIGLQMLRVEPVLKQQRFNVLLDFENGRDVVFITSAGDRKPKVQDERAHTGRSSLLIAKGSDEITVKLPLLVAGRVFPDDWALVGAYFYAESAGTLEISYRVGDQKLLDNSTTLTAGNWTPVFLDLSKLSDPNRTPVASVGTLVFKFEQPTADAVWMDDVVLIDNAKSLVGDVADSAGPWTIRRKGFRIYGDQPGRFNFVLSTPEASTDGWTIEETNEMRARFNSIGQVKSLTVYSDGRAYWDGIYKPMSGKDSVHAHYAQQHESPAELAVPETVGRVDRNSPGDANNDGYNECSGAYVFIATGPRFEARLSPRTPALVRPWLEITGLPEGKVLVTMEGQLVDRMIRLDDGTLLVELPARIERPTTVQFRVQ
jgi:hypothetical protein